MRSDYRSPSRRRSLGCGGLITECCQSGRPPVVVFLTDGAMSHPASKRFPRERLVEVREQEAIAAAACLGLTRERLVFLRTPDTQAPREGDELARVVKEIVWFDKSVFDAPAFSRPGSLIAL